MNAQPLLPTINRSLLIIRAKAPFIEWLRKLPTPNGIHDETITEESVNDDPPCFLIPNDCDPDDALEYYLPLIVNEIFSAWCTQDVLWPKKLRHKEFLKWFDVTWSTMMFDCNSKEPLDYDE